jgi:hypothetical protein
MKDATNENRLAAAVFVIVLLHNLAHRSLLFNFDGVACAIAVELSDFRHLVHGNHLAYGIVAWLFDRAWRVLGYAGPAILPLQVLDSMLGAAGAAVFASLLRRSGRTEREAFLGAAALAVSSVWWLWSLEAQVYMLGALFAVLAAREALGEKPRPAVVGLWHAAAVLGHVGHVMALPALAWALTRRRGRKSWLPYAAALFTVLLAAYAAAGLLAVRPRSFDELRLWLLGSAALGVDRSFAWHAAAESAFSAWAAMTARIFCDFAGRAGIRRFAGLLLGLLPLAAAAAGAAHGESPAKRAERPARFWLIWLAGYAALYLNWEPYTAVYRVTDLLALWALALLGLESLSARARSAALLAWVGAAAAFNMTYTIRPASEPGTNQDYFEARWSAAHIPGDAWVLSYGNGSVYLPYFAHLKTLNLRYYARPEALYARLDELSARGESAYVTDRTLEQTGSLAVVADYGLEPASAEDGLALYRVRRPVKAGASRAGARRRN